MYLYTISTYALTLLVHQVGGVIHIEIPGVVECGRSSVTNGFHRRTYDARLPEAQRLLARAKAIRNAVHDCYPEFFSPE